MHQREVVAAGGGTLTDSLHDVWTVVYALLTFLSVGFAAKSFDRRFRRYSIFTLAVLVVTGALTAVEGPRVDANLPTPWIGICERIFIAAWLLWVVALAANLLQTRSEQRNGPM
jgi:ABC-type transport system involved in cytochrome c biogenesis permease subunit